jgi:hypothetical protein
VGQGHFFAGEAETRVAARVAQFVTATLAPG